MLIRPTMLLDNIVTDCVEQWSKDVILKLSFLQSL